MAVPQAFGHLKRFNILANQHEMDQCQLDRIHEQLHTTHSFQVSEQPIGCQTTAHGVRYRVHDDMKGCLTQLSCCGAVDRSLCSSKRKIKSSLKGKRQTVTRVVSRVLGEMEKRNICEAFQEGYMLIT